MELCHAVESERNAKNQMSEILEQVQSPKGIIRLNGEFHLTKTRKDYVDATLKRDFELEADTARWISKRASFNSIMGRYWGYDSGLKDLGWPLHYPVRVLKGIGSVCSSDNIFMFFPEVLGVHTGEEEDYFGLEFIDVWAEIFRSSIFPCVNRTFDSSTNLELATMLRFTLDKTIFLASIFHEVGHRVGPYKVSPVRHEKIKINQFHTDILGELSTDALLVENLEEFPEIAQFVFFQRLFWFPRRGFSNSPLKSKINEDNDAWIGALLWNRATELGALQLVNNRWKISNEAIRDVFKKIRIEIDDLAKELMPLNGKQQDMLVKHWMCNSVPNQSDQFYLPEGLQQVFRRCADIIERPNFKPALPND